MITLKDLPFTSAALATLLSLHGLRKKSLSPDGALTAFIVGTGIMAGGLKVFGLALAGFYLLGSRATKYGKKRKGGLEEGYQEAGYRSGWQVLCNSIWGFLAAVIWNVMYSPSSIQAKLLGGIIASDQEAYISEGWCAVRRGWSRTLIFGVLGHFGCCLGDTLASELGILSDSPPRLVTTWKIVPPGTNGGMSVGGTIWSGIGGMLIGAMMGATLVIENQACDMWILVEMVGWGTFAGLFGSLVDSLLGATVQQTRYSKEKRVILTSEGNKDEAYKVISGFNVLTNNQVNLLSSFLSTLVVAVMASHL